MPNQSQPSSQTVPEREITCRSLAMRGSSINEDERSFEAVVSSETPAVVWDWRNRRFVEEILRSSGGIFPEAVVLLDDHFRFGSDSVIGTATDFERTNDLWTGRGIVAEPADDTDPVRRIWSRVKGGHIRAVSIGYMVRDFVDIPPGGKQRVDGRTYEAGEQGLRVTTSWEVHELSLTPIGADSAALIRSGLPVRQQPGDARPQKRSYFR